MASSFLLQSVYDIQDSGLVIAGKVEGSSLEVGMKTFVEGYGFQIKSITLGPDRLNQARPGKNIGAGLYVVEKPKTGFLSSKTKPRDVLAKLKGSYLIFT